MTADSMTGIKAASKNVKIISHNLTKLHSSNFIGSFNAKILQPVHCICIL